MLSVAMARGCSVGPGLLEAARRSAIASPDPLDSAAKFGQRAVFQIFENECPITRQQRIRNSMSLVD